MAISDIPGDLEQTKRRPALSNAPLGIGLTPEQQKTRADAEWRQGAQQRQAEFKRGVGEVAGGIGDAINMAARSVASFPLAAGHSIANANIYDRPFDYSTPAKEAVKPGPAPHQQAGGIAAFDIAKRATDAATRPFGIPRPMQHPSSPAKTGQVSGGPEKPIANMQAAASPAVSAASPPPLSAGGIGEWSRTGIGTGRAGGEIVGRVGANGAPEFSNAAPAVERAGQQRAVGRVGDGIGGGLSVGQAGDAQLAIDRFERANAERAKTIDMLKRYEPSGVHIVGQDKLTPDEVLKARLDLRERDMRLQETDQQQRAIDAGLDRGLRERELVGTERRNALDAERTRQEIETGNLTLAQQRQVANLYTRYEQAPPEERAALAEQIRTLTGKEAPNRFTVVSGGQEYDTSANALVNRPSRVFNNQTGQFVDGGGKQQGGITSDQRALAIRNDTNMTREQKVAALQALGYN